MSKVTIKVKSRLSQAIQDKLGEINNATTMLQIYNTLAKRCDPYVPYLYGPLSETVQVTPKSVKYVQPYARYQYYGDNFNHTLDKHPLASARWDQAMMRDHGDEFIKEVQDILDWRLMKVGSR